MQVIGFMVGGAMFFASFGALVWAIEVAADPAPGAHANQEVDAGALAKLLASDPGAGWATPDALARLGLAGADGRTLDADHLLLLNNASLDPLPNGLVEYEEARAAWGLSGAAGFRLRVVAVDYEAALQNHDFSYVKALYVGDFGSLTPITLTSAEATIPQANAALNASMAANTGLERTVIDSIGVDFDNQAHLLVNTPDIDVQPDPNSSDTTPLLTYLGLSSWDGDVVHDNKQFLDAVLPGKLSSGGYDLLVLGSGIDHSTLTANSVKTAINDFVRNGGTLMVFGSPGANFNWMQPIMDLSAASVSGPVSAPDPDNGLLSLPYDLDWASYPTNDLGWTIGNPSDFENVLMQGGKPVIAISDEGAIGSGRVFLSSIQPRAVAQSLGTDEAAHFMFNMLLQGYEPPRDPSLEFGPDPPVGLPASSAVRTAVVSEAGTDIPVRIDLLAWGT
ncbi:MAG: hypothetical protein AABY18_08940 [Candidatus Thermoplasmatota archaeon]